MSYSIRNGVAKARKDHTCDLCLLKILKGVKHSFNVGVDCGVATTWRYHVICISKTKDWDSDDWENCQEIVGSFFRTEYGITQEVIDGGVWVPQGI